MRGGTCSEHMHVLCMYVLLNTLFILNTFMYVTRTRSILWISFCKKVLHTHVFVRTPGPAKQFFLDKKKPGEPGRSHTGDVC